MAESRHIYDFGSLIQDSKTSEISSVRKDYEAKVSAAIPTKTDLFRKGKLARDLNAELLIPNHMGDNWRALK